MHTTRVIGLRFMESTHISTSFDKSADSFKIAVFGSINGQGEGNMGPSEKHNGERANDPVVDTDQ